MATLQPSPTSARAPIWYEAGSDDEEDSSEVQQHEQQDAHHRFAGAVAVTVGADLSDESAYSSAALAAASRAHASALAVRAPDVVSPQADRAPRARALSPSPASPSSRSRTSKGARCSDFVALSYAGLIMMGSGALAAFALNARSLYSSELLACSAPLSMYMLASGVQSAIFAALLFVYVTCQLRGICRSQPLNSFLSNSGGIFAVELLLLLSALAQMAVGVWGEAWMSTTGLLRNLVTPLACGAASASSSLFMAASTLAMAELAAAVLMLASLLILAAAAACRPRKNRARARSSPRSSSTTPILASRGGRDTLARTSTAPIPVTVVPASLPVSHTASAFKGSSYSLSPSSDAAATGKPRRDRANRVKHSRSCT